MDQGAIDRAAVDCAAVDRAAVDRAYDNSAAFPDVDAWRARWQTRNQQLVLPRGSQLDLAYGQEPRQRIDLFPLDPRGEHSRGAPTMLFFHGGFWARNGKETFRFLLDAAHRAGYNAAFAGYTLAPAAHIGAIVGEAAAATQWLFAHLSDFGLAPLPLVVIGWSAGAHLVAMQMDQPNIAAGMAISGIYDLEPMRIGSMNEFLCLDELAVARHSPTRRAPLRSAPLLVAYGARELPEFQRQSVEFHTAWQARALPVTVMSLPERHHHSALEELYLPDGLLQAQLGRMRRYCHV
jgi:acetyl esterase/lipase